MYEEERVMGKTLRKCKVCGEKFYASDEYVYKIRKCAGGTYWWFCSWTCKRKFERETEAKRK